MKICFIIEHYYPYIGGVEKLFLQLTQKLASENHKVRVITTRFDKSLPEKEIINDVEVIRLNLRNRYLFSFFGFFFMIKKVKGFDVIHSTTYNAAFPAFFTGLITRKKVIVTFHEYWGAMWFSLPYLNSVERILFWTYEQIVLRLPYDEIIAVSDYTKNCLIRKIPKRKISRIYNGLEYPSQIPYVKHDREEFVFTFFGRLGVSKGIDIVIGACELIKKSRKNLKCRMIIPKVPYAFYKKVLKEIEKRDIGDLISLKHNLSDLELEKEILQSNCVVIPSYTEGFCFAATESISKGVPVIVSGRGALPEVVSGTFIVMDDLTPESLLKSLEKAKNGEWIERPIKKFELSKQIDDYANMYSVRYNKRNKFNNFEASSNTSK